MSWNRGLIQVQNIRLKNNCILKCTITAAALFALPLSATLDTQQNGWNTAGSLKDHLASKIVRMQISSILRQKFFVFKTVELRFVCNNNAIQSSLLFHQNPSDNLSLNTNLNLFSQDWALFASSIVSCIFLVSCWHNAAGNSQMGSFLQPNLPSESRCHYLGDISCYALYYYNLPSPAWKPSAESAQT